MSATDGKTMAQGHLRGQKGWERMRMTLPALVGTEDRNAWLLCAAVDMSYETGREPKVCLAHVNGHLPNPVQGEATLRILERSVKKHAYWLRGQAPRRVRTMMNVRKFRCWEPQLERPADAPEAYFEPGPEFVPFGLLGAGKDLAVPVTTEVSSQVKMPGWQEQARRSKRGFSFGYAPAQEQVKEQSNGGIHKPQEGTTMKTNGKVVGVMEQGFAIKQFKEALVADDVDRMDEIYNGEVDALRLQIDTLTVAIKGWERRKRAIDAMRDDA